MTGISKNPTKMIKKTKKSPKLNLRKNNFPKSNGMDLFTKVENLSTHLLFIKSKVPHNNSMMFLISRLTKKSLCHHQKMIDILNRHSNKMKITKDYTRKMPIRKCQPEL